MVLPLEADCCGMQAVFIERKHSPELTCCSLLVSGDQWALKHPTQDMFSMFWKTYLMTEQVTTRAGRSKLCNRRAAPDIGRQAGR